MRRVLGTVLLALGVVWVLGYLTSLGSLYWARDLRQVPLADSLYWMREFRAAALPPGISVRLPAAAPFRPSPLAFDWDVAALLALAAAAVVLGVAAGLTPRRPAFGLIAGIPLAVAGVLGASGLTQARDLVGRVPAIAGPDAPRAALDEAMAGLLGTGVSLVAGTVLVAAAFGPLRLHGRPALGPVTSFGLGLLVFGGVLASWSENWRWESGPRLWVLAGTAVALAWLAVSRSLSQLTALACGVPLFALGAWTLVDGAGFRSVLDWLPLPADWEAGLASAATQGTRLYVLLGGAVVVAALMPRRDSPAG